MAQIMMLMHPPCESGRMSLSGMCAVSRSCLYIRNFLRHGTRLNASPLFWRKSASVKHFLVERASCGGQEGSGGYTSAMALRDASAASCAVVPGAWHGSAERGEWRGEGGEGRGQRCRSQRVQRARACAHLAEEAVEPPVVAPAAA